MGKVTIIIESDTLDTKPLFVSGLILKEVYHVVKICQSRL